MFFPISYKGGKPSLGTSVLEYFLRVDFSERQFSGLVFWWLYVVLIYTCQDII